MKTRCSSCFSWFIDDCRFVLVHVKSMAISRQDVVEFKQGNKAYVLLMFIGCLSLLAIDIGLLLFIIVKQLKTYVIVWKKPWIMWIEAVMSAVYVAAGRTPWRMLGIQWQRGLPSRAVVSCHHSDWSVNRTHTSVTGSCWQHQQCTTRLHCLGEILLSV